MGFSLSQVFNNELDLEWNVRACYLEGMIIVSLVDLVELTGHPRVIHTLTSPANVNPTASAVESLILSLILHLPVDSSAVGTRTWFETRLWIAQHVIEGILEELL